jgi:hypothetical protein
MVKIISEFVGPSNDHLVLVGGSYLTKSNHIANLSNLTRTSPKAHTLASLNANQCTLTASSAAETSLSSTVYWFPRTSVPGIIGFDPPLFCSINSTPVLKIL